MYRTLILATVATALASINLGVEAMLVVIIAGSTNCVKAASRLATPSLTKI